MFLFLLSALFTAYLAIGFFINIKNERYGKTFMFYSLYFISAIVTYSLYQTI